MGPVLVRLQRRAPLIVLVVLSACFTLWMLNLIRHQWFVLDDFDYMHADQGRSWPEWLIAPHNEHTIVFTKLWFSVLYKSFGLQHYWLYALPLIAGHLAMVGAGARLLRLAGGSPWLATLGALPLLAMGGAHTTLVWAGQSQYAWPLACGLWAIVLLAETQRGHRIPVWLFGALALVGTFAGSAFLPFGIVAGLGLCAIKRWTAGVIVAAVPLAWFGAERLLWTIPSSYGPEDLTDLLHSGPAYGWTLFDRAIGDTLGLPGFSATVVALIGLGAVAVVRRPAQGAEEATAQALVTSTAAVTVLSVAAVVAARQNVPGGENGGHNYLVLVSLLPLAILVLARPVLRSRRSIQVIAGCFAVLLAATSAATIKTYSRDIATWTQDGRTLIEGAAALTADPDFQVIDKGVALGTSAPTMTWRRIAGAADAGKITRVRPSRALRDRISLVTQWRTRRTSGTAIACKPLTSNEVVPPGSTLKASSSTTALALRYRASDAPETIRAIPGAMQSLVSTSGRSVLVAPNAGTVSICG